MIYKIIALLGLISLSSCDSNSFSASRGSQTEVELNTVSQRFDRTQVLTAPPVDIIFGVDTSGSMSTEKSKLQENMKNFIALFKSSASQIDFRVLLVGDGFSFPEADSQVSVLNTAISSNNALFVFTNIFGGGKKHRGLLREQSQKHFIVVTDDNANSSSLSSFETMLSRDSFFTGRTKLGGLIGLASSKQSSWCKIARVGAAYETLGAKNGGIIRDLCLEDWKALLEDFASEIINQEIANTFTLDEAADSSKEIIVTLGEKKLKASQFSFDKNTSTLTLNKDLLIGNSLTLLVVYTKKN